MYLIIRLRRGRVVINEKKVGLMTKISIYEKKEENRELVISKYYKTDYVRYNVLKQLVASTVFYWGAVACYIFMKFEDMLAKINQIDYFDLMYKLLGGYVVFCFAYFVFAYSVYTYRYGHAKKGLTKYNKHLRRLIDLEGGGKSKSKSISNNEMDEFFAESERLAFLKKKAGNYETGNEDELALDMEEQRIPVTNSRKVNVSRMDMLNQRIKESEEQKKQQIIANANRLKERQQLQELLKEQHDATVEEERQRIRNRRMEIEREQMEKLRIEREQRMAQRRDDYTFKLKENEKDINNIQGGE